MILPNVYIVIYPSLCYIDSGRDLRDMNELVCKDGYLSDQLYIFPSMEHTLSSFADCNFPEKKESP